ncbi:synaptotagmin-like protein 5 isoform X3 [Dreissena polymorpha]|uniref:synaptotagmin-like protein 5 isoform X3 n=1 Tax=Dreissena polymorpha TaxID=45954 RepID=UPI0022640C35|nr:synaptotagmin-like protein 5 isoform X3 [Dreissena polymorpha]
MDPCISVVEGLSQREKNSILAVLQRDEKLRVGQEHKITELKHEINTIRMCSVMRAGDNHGKMCLRCRSELGMIFNRGDLCPACRFKVCKQCQEVMFNGSWLCILCYKQRQLKWLSGEWAASFEQNPLRKWASGSDLKQGTLQLMPGTTEINIDDSPPRQATNNKSRKIARNGVSKHDDQKSKVEVPKEGDQVKLLELFNVLRVKKPQEEASAEMQVKHIKTRGYSDSDSDSSSNSDSEVRSSSTALSMTESEIDTHRVDSPIMEEVAQVSRLESSSQRRESSRDLDSPRRLIPHNVDKMETRSSQQVTNLESQNPAHSKHSLNSAMNQKGRSLGRAQSQGGQSKRPSLDAEAQSSMNRPGDDVSFEGSSEHSGEADSLSLHSNLNEHVRKTREILGEKHAQSQVQKVNSSIAHDHEMAARPKIRQQLVTGAEHSRKSSKQGAEANIRPSADEREMKDNEMHPYKKPVKVHVTSDSDTSSISSKSKLRASFDEDTESVGNMSVPRAGSPYSFSMESLPSSNPSPTMQRRAHHSGSLQDSSDNDSVSRGSESSSQGRHTPRKQGSEEEFVVEELSKVRFRRVANTLEKMALMTNMKKSPNRKNPATRVESPQSVSENSSIHEDSGHGSGASQVTTPEHKRTDSSFSQSSIPSTHSTVTDEDEDIDSVVARVQRKQQMMQSNRGNLLSVFGDSRESIASYYSDAGDVSYSKIPVTGEILFSISYNYKTGMLEVGIKNCKDIAVVDAKRNRSDPYVKTYLLPDRTRGGKRKTKVKKSTINPQFDETLRYSISKSELENRTLWVTVWHNDRFGRNVFLGEVTINFDYYKFDDPSPRWYPLQERMDYQPAAMMVYKGDLSISLRYVTAEHSSKLSGKKEVKSGVKGQGQLEVTVKEARNLTGVKSNGFSDPFCKGYLLPERHKSSKQKTKVIRKDCNPCWNHTFIFEDVSLAELKERCLELTVWDYEKLSSNDFLGGARLNLGSGESQGHQVDWMDARGEEMSMWQAMLDRPNLWIDGVLILRANMDKRKY